jgi:DNA-binding beta-propeller fold protein YncE
LTPKNFTVETYSFSTFMAQATLASNDGMITVAISKMDGSQTELQVSSSATVRELKDLINSHRSEAEVVFDFNLVTDAGDVLKDLNARLAEAGVQDGTVLMFVSKRTRDYTKISEFDRVFQCKAYPNGVLINKRGELLSCHYSGALQVYDSNFTLSSEHQLPENNPGQMAFADTGDLLIGFYRQIGVFDGETFQFKRWIGNDLQYIRGLAVSSNYVFASDTRSNLIHKYSLEDGKLLDSFGKCGGACSFRHPCGLRVLDDRLLVVADRKNNRVQLLDLDGSHVADIGANEDGAKAEAVLCEPNDVAVDPDGNLLVMDTVNERIAVFREDGSLIASVMPGFFKDHRNTYSYVSCNHVTGAIVTSNNDEHSIAILSPLFSSD